MSENAEDTHETGEMDRRSIFRGAAALGGLGVSSLLAAGVPLRAVAAEQHPAPGAIGALQAQTQRVLRWSAPNPGNWVRPRSNVDHNVVIVGGGQSGISLGHWLARKGIGGVQIIDQGEPGQAGIWRTIARNRKLLTAKNQIGPEQANAALSFQAWYETLHGTAAFEALDRVPRLAWADYLDWFQQITATPVRSRTRLLGIEPARDVLRVHLESDGAPRVETTRKLVLAGGFASTGGANIPEIIRSLPASAWTHTASHINFDRWKGKVLGVLGAGASAFDAAATAVEAGAAEVHLFARRPDIGYMTEVAVARPRPGIEAEDAAPLELSYWLPDIVRWRAQLAKDRVPSAVPQDSLNRIIGSDRFYLHVSSPWTETAVGGDGTVAVKVNDRTFHFDHVIAGTGYRTNLAAQPEFAQIHEHIALWRDRYQPEAGESNPSAGAYPYLGPNLQFLPRQEQGGEFLRNIYCLNAAASISYGTLVGNVTSMKLQPQLIAAIGQDFITEGVDISANKAVLNPRPPQDPAPYRRAIRG